MKRFRFIAIAAICMLTICGMITGPAFAQAYRPYTKTIELTVQNVPTFESGLGLVTSGTEWFVDSNASGTAAGTSWTNACLTVDACIDLSSSGDLIKVSETHAETCAAADCFDMDVEGITIHMMGEGANAPAFTFSETAATIACGAANNTLIGGRYLAGKSAVVIGIAIEAGCDNFTLVDAIFPEPTTDSFEFVDAIDLAALADGVHIIRPVFRNADATGGAHFIEMGNGVNKDFQLIGADVFGEFSVAAVWSNDADEEVLVIGGQFTNLTADEFAVEFAGAATGAIIGVLARTDTQAKAIDFGSMSNVQNLWDDEDTANTIAIPVIAGGPATQALADVHLNHFFALDGASQLYPETAVEDSALCKMLGDDNPAVCTTYNNSTDSFEALGIKTTAIEADTISISGGTLPTEVVSDSLAAFIASGGTALGTELGASQSLVDVLGNDGTGTTRAGDLDAADLQARIDAISAAMGIVVAAGADGFEEDGTGGDLYDMFNSTDTNTNFFSGDGNTNYDDNLFSFLKEMSKYVVDGDGDFATGTALASDKSLVDAIGTNGTTVADTVTGVAGMIGVNDDDNAMVTTAVVSNNDGSAYERLEYLSQMSEQVLAGLMASGRSVGDVWYVDSVTGLETDDGTTWALAEALITEAVVDATASKGDIIFVAPGHAETIAAATAINKIGLTIIGLGTGSTRPIITMNNAVSSFDISVAGVTMKNLNLYNTTAATANAFDLAAGADYTILDGIQFRDTGANNYVFTIGVLLASGTDNVTIQNCDVYNTQTGATSFVDATTGIVTGLKILDNSVWGQYSAAAVVSDKAITNSALSGNTIRNITTGVHAVELSAAATGYITDNILASDLPGLILDPGSMLAYNNTIVETDVTDANDLGMMKDDWNYAVATFLLDATATTDDIFTVTGMVEVKVFGQVTETLTSSGDTVGVGTTDSLVILIANTAGSAPMTSGDVWTSATMAKSAAGPTTVIIDTDNICITQSSTGLVDGTVVIQVYWRPLEAGASVVPI